MAHSVVPTVDTNYLILTRNTIPEVAGLLFGGQSMRVRYHTKWNGMEGLNVGVAVVLLIWDTSFWTALFQVKCQKSCLKAAHPQIHVGNKPMGTSQGFVSMAHLCAMTNKNKNNILCSDLPYCQNVSCQGSAYFHEFRG
mmetsp:Transcript_20331/g.36687  ORF Transcript_20331/g.36687 Transcript_20331/m.36687 type:complete len:139 (-) Transcript_20331:75-491(-)